ncbi:MAG: hypothetical protein GTO03_00730 [Planctomycetales bacterium]|nr:hypothetical protein [Planctomycetales bacterium]
MPEPSARRVQPARYQFAEMAGPREADAAGLAEWPKAAPAPAAPPPAFGQLASLIADPVPNPGPQACGGEDRQAAAALQALVERLDQVHHQWQAAAENEVVQLAFALAERIVRRQIERDPQIPLDLVREAIQLVGRGKRVRIALHPADFRLHQDALRRLSVTLQQTGEVELVGDQRVERGGCVVETPDGLIDQTITAQLQRIREELQP